jgi:hypothetical protein
MLIVLAAMPPEKLERKCYFELHCTLSNRKPSFTRWRSYRPYFRPCGIVLSMNFQGHQGDAGSRFSPGDFVCNQCGLVTTVSLRLRINEISQS